MKHNVQGRSSNSIGMHLSRQFCSCNPPTLSLSPLGGLSVTVLELHLCVLHHHARNGNPVSDAFHVLHAMEGSAKDKGPTQPYS